MRSILVTGAAGAVGGRVLSIMAERRSIGRVVALDRVPISAPSRRPEAGAEVETEARPAAESPAETVSETVHETAAEPVAETILETVMADLGTGDLQTVLAGVDTVVHLAEDRSRKANVLVARSILQRLLSAAADASVKQLVLLSSALVYGANSDNPVPITEDQPLRPTSLAHAQLKADLEALATSWADQSGVELTVLRPAVALSDGDSSWIGSALRAAMAVRPEQVDPPVQFVHHDDLARAVVHVVEHRLPGVYNVASDGWIGADAFRALRGETEVRLPERAGRVRHRAAKMFADRSLLEGLEPYITHPWVVATDKLQSTGWKNTYSNEEVYILGTSAPLLNSLGPQKRQEFALGLAGAAGAAALGAAVWTARRLTR